MPQEISETALPQRPSLFCDECDCRMFEDNVPRRLLCDHCLRRATEFQINVWHGEHSSCFYVTAMSPQYKNGDYDGAHILTSFRDWAKAEQYLARLREFVNPYRGIAATRKEMIL